LWTVIYLVKSKESALSMKALLEKNKILCNMRPAVVSNASDSGSYIELLVPETEVSQAHNILIENGF